MLTLRSLALRSSRRCADAQVQELLEAEPGNAEYLDLQTSLLEVRGAVRGRCTHNRFRFRFPFSVAHGCVLDSSHALSCVRARAQVVALTEDLLRSVAPPAGGAAGGGGSAAPPPPHGFSDAPSATAYAPPLALLRTNWAPGESCSALFSDGLWHPATIQSGAPSGAFRVLFDHYAVPVTLPPASLRASARSGGAEEVYVGVPAPKRLKVDERLPGRDAPKKLEVKDDDDERTRERKKKLLKSFKSKQRLAEADAEQTERAASWQAFRTGKGAAKAKPGFLTSTKKESIFKVPEGGRVGVIGSGQGLTPAAERRKNQF
jgi:survival-of-motor-neuron-related-splicing factor 30